MMKEFIIDGNKFHTPKAFFRYAEKIFTSGLSWETGRNLDAFADLIEGGFGQHDFGEKIKVTWINMEKSKERLSKKYLEALIEILDEAGNVTFESYGFGK